MASLPQIQIRGLHTNNSELSQTPEGSISDCNNVVIDKNSIAEQRRGLKLYGGAMGVSASADIAKQLFTYKERILRHFSSTLDYDNGSGSFSSFSGTFNELSSGVKLRGLEASGNFYFTASDSIKKISAASASDFTTASGYITNAGGIKALDTSLSINSQEGFLAQNSKVAYRIVWGIKDANNLLVLGSPSSRSVIEFSMSLQMVKDFNNLLATLDTEAAADPSDELSDTDYVSTLKIPAEVGASASVLRNNLISLATKLENDVNKIANPTYTRTTASASLTSNIATVVFSTTIPSWVVPGITVRISGLSTPLDVLNGDRVVTSIGASSISFALTNANIASTPDTGGTVTQYEFTAIAQPAAPSDNPTTSELTVIQTYYDAIVETLQAEDSAKIAGNTGGLSPFDNSFSIQSATVDLSFTVPQDATTAHFYQIYRSAVATAIGTVTLADIDPGDELGLVYESNPTTAQISAKTVTVQDITPESFRGANLYTNPQSGEGILQANEIPPIATDIASFKNHLFYANTKTKHKYTTSLLGVSNLVSATSQLNISNGTTTDTYTFVNPVAESTTVQTVADVAGSLAGTYFRVNAAEDATQYYVWYKVSGVGADPALSGLTGIQVDVVTNDTANTVALKTQTELQKLNDFTVTVITNTVYIVNIKKGIATNATANTSGFTVTTLVAGAGEDITNKKVVISDAATPAQQVDETARSLIRVINRQSTGLIYAFYLSGPNDVPGQILFENRLLSGSQFYLFVDDKDTTGISFSPSLPDNSVIGYATQQTSDNEVAGNRVYYSKFQQPEAVPIVNYFDVGPKDKAILRILPIRDSLFVLKEDGIYRISGEGGTVGFTLALFDNTIKPIGTNSAVVLNNSVFFFSDQGIGTISDTGISIISRPIENQLSKLITYSGFRSATCGVAYEADRAFILFTVTNRNDTKATQAFRYNFFTQEWTKWKLGKTCAVTLSNVLYTGATDINHIEQERKMYDRTDYCDREYSKVLLEDSVSDNIVTLPSLTNIKVGDVLLQEQYLTIYKLNQLLKKLDLDNGVNDADYYSSLGAVAGDELRNILTALATKLDNDSGLTFTNYASSISSYTSSFVDTQLAYNEIIDLLNTDPGAQFNNYSLSTGTITYESVITAKDDYFIKATLLYSLPLVAGPIKTFEHINFEITFNVNPMGDPELFKHVSFGKFIFNHTNFSNATAAFASDVSPAFEEIQFSKQGNGAFGYTSNEEDNFGGEGDKSPFRTIIPRNKQRCRYIIPRLKHEVARETIQLLGYAVDMNPYSTRPYRG